MDRAVTKRRGLFEVSSHVSKRQKKGKKCQTKPRKHLAPVDLYPHGFAGFSTTEFDASCVKAALSNNLITEEDKNERKLEKEVLFIEGLTCTLCDLTLSSVSHLHIHKVFCGNKSLFSPGKTALRPEHEVLLLEPSSGMLACPWCPVLSSSMRMLDKHLPLCREVCKSKQAQLTKDLPCPECFNKFKDLDSLLMHLQSHYLSDLKCFPCRKLFSCRASLIDHIPMCNDKMHQCSDCFRSFRDGKSFKVHVSNCNTSLQCLKCASMSLRRDSSMKHMEEHLKQEWLRMGFRVADGSLQKVMDVRFQTPTVQEEKETVPLPIINMPIIGMNFQEKSKHVESSALTDSMSNIGPIIIDSSETESDDDIFVIEKEDCAPFGNKKQSLNEFLTSRTRSSCICNCWSNSGVSSGSYQRNTHESLSEIFTPAEADGSCHDSDNGFCLTVVNVEGGANLFNWDECEAGHEAVEQDEGNDVLEVIELESNTDESVASCTSVNAMCDVACDNRVVSSETPGVKEISSVTKSNAVEDIGKKNISPNLSATSKCNIKKINKEKNCSNSSTSLYHGKFSSKEKKEETRSNENTDSCSLVETQTHNNSSPLKSPIHCDAFAETENSNKGSNGESCVDVANNILPIGTDLVNSDVALEVTVSTHGVDPVQSDCTSKESIPNPSDSANLPTSTHEKSTAKKKVFSPLVEHTYALKSSMEPNTSKFSRKYVPKRQVRGDSGKLHIEETKQKGKGTNKSVNKPMNAKCDNKTNHVEAADNNALNTKKRTKKKEKGNNSFGTDSIEDNSGIKLNNACANIQRQENKLFGSWTDMLITTQKAEGPQNEPKEGAAIAVNESFHEKSPEMFVVNDLTTGVDSSVSIECKTSPSNINSEQQSSAFLNLPVFPISSNVNEKAPNESKQGDGSTLDNHDSNFQKKEELKLAFLENQDVKETVNVQLDHSNRLSTEVPNKSKDLELTGDIKSKILFKEGTRTGYINMPRNYTLVTSFNQLKLPCLQTVTSIPSDVKTFSDGKASYILLPVSSEKLQTQCVQSYVKSASPTSTAFKSSLSSTITTVVPSVGQELSIASQDHVLPKESCVQNHKPVPIMLRPVLNSSVQPLCNGFPAATKLNTSGYVKNNLVQQLSTVKQAENSLKCGFSKFPVVKTILKSPVVLTSVGKVPVEGTLAGTHEISQLRQKPVAQVGTCTTQPFPAKFVLSNFKNVSALQDAPRFVKLSKSTQLSQAPTSVILCNSSSSTLAKPLSVLGESQGNMGSCTSPTANNYTSIQHGNGKLVNNHQKVPLTRPDEKCSPEIVLGNRVGSSQGENFKPVHNSAFQEVRGNCSEVEIKNNKTKSLFDSIPENTNVTNSALMEALMKPVIFSPFLQDNTEIWQNLASSNFHADPQVSNKFQADPDRMLSNTNRAVDLLNIAFVPSIDASAVTDDLKEDCCRNIQNLKPGVKSCSDSENKLKPAYCSASGGKEKEAVSFNESYLKGVSKLSTEVSDTKDSSRTKKFSSKKNIEKKTDGNNEEGSSPVGSLVRHSNKTFVSATFESSTKKINHNKTHPDMCDTRMPLTQLNDCNAKTTGRNNAKKKPRQSMRDGVLEVLRTTVPDLGKYSIVLMASSSDEEEEEEKEDAASSLGHSLISKAQSASQCAANVQVTTDVKDSKTPEHSDSCSFQTNVCSTLKNLDAFHTKGSEKSLNVSHLNSSSSLIEEPCLTELDTNSARDISTGISPGISSIHISQGMKRIHSQLEITRSSPMDLTPIEIELKNASLVKCNQNQVEPVDKSHLLMSSELKQASKSAAIENLSGFTGTSTILNCPLSARIKHSNVIINHQLEDKSDLLKCSFSSTSVKENIASYPATIINWAISSKSTDSNLMQHSENTKDLSVSTFAEVSNSETMIKCSLLSQNKYSEAQSPSKHKDDVFNSACVQEKVLHPSLNISDIDCGSSPQERLCCEEDSKDNQVDEFPSGIENEVVPDHQRSCDTPSNIVSNLQTFNSEENAKNFEERKHAALCKSIVDNFSESLNVEGDGITVPIPCGHVATGNAPLKSLQNISDKISSFSVNSNDFDGAVNLVSATSIQNSDHVKNAFVLSRKNNILCENSHATKLLNTEGTLLLLNNPFEEGIISHSSIGDQRNTSKDKNALIILSEKQENVSVTTQRKKQLSFNNTNSCKFRQLMFQMNTLERKRPGREGVHRKPKNHRMKCYCCCSSFYSNAQHQAHQCLLKTWAEKVATSEDFAESHHTGLKSGNQLTESSAVKQRAIKQKQPKSFPSYRKMSTNPFDFDRSDVSLILLPKTSISNKNTTDIGKCLLEAGDKAFLKEKTGLDDFFGSFNKNSKRSSVYPSYRTAAVNSNNLSICVPVYKPKKEFISRNGTIMLRRLVLEVNAIKSKRFGREGMHRKIKGSELVCLYCNYVSDHEKQLNDHRCVLKSWSNKMFCQTTSDEIFGKVTITKNTALEPKLGLNLKKAEEKKQRQSKGFLCQDCNIVFCNFMSYKQHRIQGHNEDEKLICHLCKKEFDHIQKLAVHYARSHPMDVSPPDLASLQSHKKCLSMCPKKRKKNSNSYQRLCSGSNAIRYANTESAKQLFKQEKRQNYRCQICCRAFSKKDQLELHIQKHKVFKKFICPFCHIDFFYKNNFDVLLFNVHVKECKTTKEDSFSTSINNLLELDKHTADDTARTCFVCLEGFESKLLLCSHIFKKHGKRRRSKGTNKDELNFESKIDVSPAFVKEEKHGHQAVPTTLENVKEEKNGILIAPNSLPSHENSILPCVSVDSSCPECKKTFNSMTSLSQHLRRQHGSSKKILCFLCGRKFSHSKTLLFHQKNMHKDKEFQLELPEKQLESDRSAKSNFQQDIEDQSKIPISVISEVSHPYNTVQSKPSASKEEDAKCSYCYKNFSDRAKFDIHKCAPRQKKLKFPCHSCGLVFKSGSVLSAHIHDCKGNLNDSLNPQISSIVETRELKTLHGYNESDNSDHGNNTYIGTSERSIASSNGSPSSDIPRSFICVDCNLSYKIYSCLKRHRIQVHKDASKFTCSVCAKGFSYPHTLKSHMQRLHSSKSGVIDVHCEGKDTDHKQVGYRCQNISKEMNLNAKPDDSSEKSAQFQLDAAGQDCSLNREQFQPISVKSEAGEEVKEPLGVSIPHVTETSWKPSLTDLVTLTDYFDLFYNPTNVQPIFGDCSSSATVACTELLKPLNVTCSSTSNCIDSDKALVEDLGGNGIVHCSVCGVCFSSVEALRNHYSNHVTGIDGGGLLP